MFGFHLRRFPVGRGQTEGGIAASVRSSSKRSIVKRWDLRRLSCGLGLALAFVGCSQEKPQAPVLRDGPVYQNDAAGMRFLVPERWHQTANSTLPDEPIEKEMLLTRYRIPTSAQGATLEILCMESSVNGDPLEYHRRPSYSIEQWEVVESPQSLELSGVKGVRFALRGEFKEMKLGKEVYVFERGNRQFHFVGLYSPADPNARQQIRRAVESLAWKSPTT